MAINSVYQAGVSGLHASQRHMLTAATQLAGAASAPISGEPAALTGSAPAESSMPATAATVSNMNKLPSLRSQDVVEPLIELRRQEHIFTASAKLVSTADRTLGSLIDVSA